MFTDVVGALMLVGPMCGCGRMIVDLAGRAMDARRVREDRVQSPWCSADRPARYSSSVTCSIHVTFVPSKASWMATWVMDDSGVAPCQCRRSGGHRRMSPATNSWTRPPCTCVQPTPSVTTSVCPRGWECHAVRAPGSNVTTAPVTREGSSRENWPRIVTRPVKKSGGPSTSSCCCLAMISVIVAFRARAAVGGERAGLPVVDRLDVLQRLHVVLRDLEVHVCVGPH